MNILRLQNLLKNFSDEQLSSEMQTPTGNVPQFLVLTEMQRRKDMRQDYSAAQAEQNQTTVAEDMMRGESAPGTPPSMAAPPSMAGLGALSQMPQQQPQQQPVRMQEGGMTQDNDYTREQLFAERSTPLGMSLPPPGTRQGGENFYTTVESAHGELGEAQDVLRNAVNQVGQVRGTIAPPRQPTRWDGGKGGGWAATPNPQQIQWQAGRGDTGMGQQLEQLAGLFNQGGVVKAQTGLYEKPSLPSAMLSSFLGLFGDDDEEKKIDPAVARQLALLGGLHRQDRMPGAEVSDDLVDIETAQIDTTPSPMPSDPRVTAGQILESNILPPESTRFGEAPVPVMSSSVRPPGVDLQGQIVEAAEQSAKDRDALGKADPEKLAASMYETITAEQLHPLLGGKHVRPTPLARTEMGPEHLSRGKPAGPATAEQLRSLALSQLKSRDPMVRTEMGPEQLNRGIPSGVVQDSVNRLIQMGAETGTDRPAPSHSVSSPPTGRGSVAEFAKELWEGMPSLGRDTSRGKSLLPSQRRERDIAVAFEAQEPPPADTPLTAHQIKAENERQVALLGQDFSVAGMSEAAQQIEEMKMLQKLAEGRAGRSAFARTEMGPSDLRRAPPLPVLSPAQLARGEKQPPSLAKTEVKAPISRQDATRKVPPPPFDAAKVLTAGGAGLVDASSPPPPPFEVPPLGKKETDLMSSGVLSSEEYAADRAKMAAPAAKPKGTLVEQYKELMADYMNKGQDQRMSNALLGASAAMLGSKSPYFGQSLGAGISGGLAAEQQYQKQLAEQQKAMMNLVGKQAELGILGRRADTAAAQVAGQIDHWADETKQAQETHGLAKATHKLAQRKATILENYYTSQAGKKKSLTEAFDTIKAELWNGESRGEYFDEKGAMFPWAMQQVFETISSSNPNKYPTPLPAAQMTSMLKEVPQLVRREAISIINGPGGPFTVVMKNGKIAKGPKASMKEANKSLEAIRAEAEKLMQDKILRIGKGSGDKGLSAGAKGRVKNVTIDTLKAAQKP